MPYAIASFWPWIPTILDPRETPPVVVAVLLLVLACVCAGAVARLSPEVRRG